MITRSRTRHFLGITLLAVGLVAPNLEAQSATRGLTVPVNATFTDATGNPGTFAGTLFIHKFVKAGDGINAVGTISGVLTDSTGLARTVATQATLPLDLAQSGAGQSGEDAASASCADFTIAQAACDILHLRLGPLDLDLLGLIVHLDQVVLDITAQPGGGLLGDLLCAIANLLGGGGVTAALGQITTLLNQVLSILG